MGSVADKLSKLMETKSAIKSAITAKGVTISDSDPFSSYAGKIAQIESGGSGEDNSTGLIEGTIKNYTGDAIKVRDYAFYHSESLESINLPNALTIGNYAFQYAENLLSAILPRATNIGNNAFYECRRMMSISLPSATEIGSGAYRNCEKLAIVDLGSASEISNNAFYGCSALATFIIRSENVCSLASTTVFYNGPLYSGEGYFYVPRTLVDAYKSATNWTRFADQIRAIEDYPDITDITEAAA